MNLIPQTLPMSAFSKTPKLVAEAIQDAPAMIMNRSDTLGMLVNPEQWNQMVTELRNLRLLAEARHVKARNDENESWVSGEEMRKLMKEKHGIVVD